MPARVVSTVQLVLVAISTCLVVVSLYLIMDAGLPKPESDEAAVAQVYGRQNKKEVPSSPTSEKTNNGKNNPSLSPTPTPSPDMSASPTPTPSPSPTPTPETNPVAEYNWEIRAVSSMKETKDKVCGQMPKDYIETWVDRAKELGANYISISTPYENPACASALAYTKLWVEVIRSRGLNVWHRHMPLAFEGIYDVPKDNSSPYLATISNYIQNNPDLFEENDIFTPIPEPQNGGIQGITYCYDNICQFESAADFNGWLRQSMQTSRNALANIGLPNLTRIGYFGFDGYVAWGHNNPDWTGVLEDETVAQMGNITIDHYPEIVGDTMENSLNELEARYPGVPIVIGEWGVISGTNHSEQILASMNAAIRTSVVGFNYWHMGAGGNESLVDYDLSPLPHYSTVQSFFKTR